MNRYSLHPKALAAAAVGLLIAVTGTMLPGPARAMETTCLTRDPSTIVKRDGVYWVYGTGRGVQQFSSKDRIHWTYRGPVFPNAPAWIAELVPRNTNNISWAPDIHFFNGTYHLYYSYSTMGSVVSGIGVATNATLDPKAWVDQGMVIHSARGDNFNTIDPCIFPDANGKMWLSFGSYFSGIKLIPIDSQTGKRAANSPIYDIARRAPGQGSAIEASCVYYHDGFYYLFVAWDGCCNGSRSTYNIRMGRSRDVTGPYLDKTGRSMMDGGGTLFLGSVYDRGTGAPFDDEVGPGHAAIFQDTDGYIFSYHEEWARDKDGATTMNVNHLAWDTDGWPRLILDPGPYKIVSNIPIHDVVQAGGGQAVRLARPNRGALVAEKAAQPGALVTWPWEGRSDQKWTLHYQGDGYYDLRSAANGKALSVVDCSTAPGARVDLASFQNLPCQLWYLQQNDDGTYTLLPRSGGKLVALDVSGCSANDGTPIQQWTTNGQDCQEFSFRVR